MRQQIRSPLLLEFANLPDDAWIRLHTLLTWGLVPFSSSTLWRKCRRGEFPKPVKVSANITGFRVGDIRRWLESPADFCRESQLRQQPPVRRTRCGRRGV